MLLVVVTGFLAAVAWLSVLGLGAFIMWRGLHGRHVDEHLRCGVCGYTLFGAVRLPERCSECGSLVAGPHACRRGPRQRRWPLVIAGAMMMVFCAAPLGLFYLPVPAAPAPAPAVALPAAAAAPTAQSPMASAPCPFCGRYHGPAITLFSDPVGRRSAMQRDRAGTAPAEAEPADAEAGEAGRGAWPRADRPWHNLRNVGGCCPHCGYPVMTPSPTPFCGQCGEDLSK